LTRYYAVFQYHRGEWKRIGQKYHARDAAEHELYRISKDLRAQGKKARLKVKATY
jgi:hypothetical protein